MLGTDSHRITESQNVRGWKGPLWVTQSNPLLKQGHQTTTPRQPSNRSLAELMWLPSVWRGKGRSNRLNARMRTAASSHGHS